MKLEKLLENVEVVKWNCTSDFEIEGIKTHSREVENNDLFVCLEGINDDGNRHLSEIETTFVALTDKEPSDKTSNTCLWQTQEKRMRKCVKTSF